MLAAGLGTRLRPLTYHLPKPMAPVLDRPVMEHILDLLRRHGFTRVHANLHYFPDLIQDRFGDGSDWGMELAYSHEPELLGTAGGVRKAMQGLGEAFVVISGDAITDIDLTALVERHREAGGIATLALRRVPDTREYGVVILAGDGRVQGFQEKPDPAEALSDLGNCGIYVFEPQIFDYFPDEPFVDWAMDVFPALLAHDVPFHGHETTDYWNDVGSLDEYRQSNVDALTGAVRVEIDQPLQAPGVYVAGSATVAKDADLEGPLFIGERCRVGAGARLDGPVVLAGDCEVGEGAALREAIALPGARIAAGAIEIGGIVAGAGLAERLRRRG